MNIKQINYFISVANHGSFSSAARECGISVQAMSKAMTDLESEFGAVLFERTHQGISLTSLGEEFLQKAAPVCTSFRELEEMGDTFGKEQSKLSLFLCAPSFCRNAKARADMAAFFDKCLEAETDVSIGTCEQGLETIREGRCDALITIGSFSHPDFDCFAIGTVPTGICMPKNHPLATQKEVTLKQLAPYRIIASKSFDHFNESIFVTYEKEGLYSEVVEPPYYDMPRQFYLKHGVCFMVNVAQLGEMLPRSVMVPIAAEDAKAIPICLITPKGAKSLAYQRLEHLLKQRI